MKWTVTLLEMWTIAYNLPSAVFKFKYVGNLTKFLFMSLIVSKEHVQLSHKYRSISCRVPQSRQTSQVQWQPRFLLEIHLYFCKKTKVTAEEEKKTIRQGNNNRSHEIIYLEEIRWERMWTCTKRCYHLCKISVIS